MISVLFSVSRCVTALAVLAILVMFVIYFYKGGSDKKSLKCTLKKDKAVGLIFGKKGPAYYYSPAAAEGHVFVGGGSGTGKTSALLIPSLRSWPGSSFCVDISGDISSHVETGRKLIFDPWSLSSAPYNIFAPIDALDDDAERIEALAQLAWLIMPELKELC